MGRPVSRGEHCSEQSEPKCPGMHLRQFSSPDHKGRHAQAPSSPALPVAATLALRRAVAARSAVAGVARRAHGGSHVAHAKDVSLTHRTLAVSRARSAASGITRRAAVLTGVTSVHRRTVAVRLVGAFPVVHFAQTARSPPAARLGAHVVDTGARHRAVGTPNRSRERTNKILNRKNDFLGTTRDQNTGRRSRPWGTCARNSTSRPPTKNTAHHTGKAPPTHTLRARSTRQVGRHTPTAPTLSRKDHLQQPPDTLRLCCTAHHTLTH